LLLVDDGEYIPGDKLCSIFDRFYQLPTKSNDLNVGTGIGLDLSRSIIELHYGSIVAHNLSKGCEFVITLPLGNSHLKADEMICNSEEYGLHPFGKDEFKEGPIIETINDETFEEIPHIVVVEDDEEIAGYLKEQLQIDYKVRVYPNGKEAFSAILQNVPSLVISDIMMPEMDGNILCSKLKTCITTNHVPVILLTAKSSDEDELQGLESGADAYIVKPFNMDILRCTISNLLHQRLVLRNKYNGNESQSDKVNIIKLESPDKKLMDRIMSVINENLSNSDLNVDMIADKVGLSRVHFYRKMKELTNQTPHSFIRNLRIKQAALLLTNSHQNITEVMYACGFTNLASFSTTFKSTFGLSPRDYQKKNSK
jgi:DNA-binding response OmpR family regulator